MSAMLDNLLVVAIGATAYLAMIHLWVGRYRDAASHWTGIWAAFATVFASARLVQLGASAPELAIAAARVQCASALLLMWSLTRLVQAVSERRAGPVVRIGCPAVCVSLAAIALATPWFRTAQALPTLGLADRAYLGVPTGPLMPLLGLLLVATLAWSLREVLRASDLRPTERRVFAATLVAYGAMGATSVAGGLDWIQTAGVGEYAPLVLALGASRLLAIRSRRHEKELERTFQARSAALRESESRYHGLIENAPIGLLSIGLDGQLQEANAALLAMLGSTREQFASSFNVASEQNAQRSGFTDMLALALRSGEVHSAEFEFDSWWGRRLVTNTTVAPRRDESGRIIGALAIVDDVTAQRAIEGQLRQAQKMEAVGQLAAGIAHEINNPMAYVRSNLSTLAEEIRALRKQLPAEPANVAGAASAKLAELETLTAECIQGVQRTVAIVRDLREFSRAGQTEHETTDVNSLVENAVRLAGTHRGAGSEIRERLAQLPPVMGAPGQLRQLFLNLLVNALRSAGPRGEVTVTTEAAGDRVLVRVHDDGPALPREERERVFEPYAAPRANGAERSLSLYISQEIAHAHGGEIRVSAEGTRGTTFEVSLPAARAEGACAT